MFFSHRSHQMSCETITLYFGDKSHHDDAHLNRWRLGAGCPVSLRVVPGDALVLQDPDHDAAIFRLALCGRVGFNLLTSAHGAWSENVGQRNAALLFEEIGHVVSALGAEFLVESGRSHRGGISFYLNHVAI